MLPFNTESQSYTTSRIVFGATKIDPNDNKELQYIHYEYTADGTLLRWLWSIF